MRLDVTLTVVYVDDRVLVAGEIEGSPSNICDVLVDDTDELNDAIGMVMRSMRKQIVRTIIERGQHGP